MISATVQRPRLTLILIVVAVALFLWPRRPVASQAAFPGYAEIPGPLSLTLRLTPPVVTPGDQLLLTASLVNEQAEAAQPVVQVTLPPGLQPGLQAVPPGVTLNLAARQLTWAPVVAGRGAQEMSLALRAETADLRQPVQTVQAALWPQAQAQTAEAGRQVTLAAWVGLPPQILSVTDVLQVPVGQPLQLHAEVAGSGPISQAWLLGDGRRVTVVDPVIMYPASGVYELTLEASNPLQSISARRSITVVPHPVARFHVDDPQPGVGQPVVFINESGGQPPLRYRWDFGDGAVSTEPAPQHAYSQPGTYQVQLAMENAYGQSTTSLFVTVDGPPAAEINIPTSVPAGQPIVGQARGDGSVTQFVWDMGDGRVYEGGAVRHVYRREGDYYVLLTAHNAYGATQRGQWVHVDPGLLNTFMPAVVRYDMRGGVAQEGGTETLLEDVPLTEEFVLATVDLPASMPPAEQLYFYINEARRQFDLEPLDLVPAMSAAAQKHTDDMSTAVETGHTGTDGSLPAERLLTFSYGGGYAGEATAWGFLHPYDAVSFWINSPAHRRIILNRYATDVGVGYTLNYGAPNIWYWTAEFGNAFARPGAPAIRLQAPENGVATVDTAEIAYRWTWPLPLADGERFLLYRVADRQVSPVAEVSAPLFDTLYGVTVAAAELAPRTDTLTWQVRLVRNGAVVAESAARTVILTPDPDAPQPAAPISPTLPALPSPTPTPTPTPGPVWPTPTPAPTVAPPPIFPTATPRP